MSFCQDSTLEKLYNGNFKEQEKYYKSIDEKLMSFNTRVDKYTSRTIDYELKTEQRLKRRLVRFDSLASGRLFNYSIDSLKKLQRLITSG
ncbi:MAG TPA: hypothetical protein VKR32_14415, partial [Puia sp.]|nr:hypothetical protein [Puia sp.]